MKREIDRRYQFDTADVLEALLLLCDNRSTQRPQSHRVSDGSIDLTLSPNGALLHWVDEGED